MARVWSTITEADAIAADAAAKVPTSRTITAGTGLTGGGDLSANRTLTVSYGTASGTAAQGNDARLSLPRRALILFAVNEPNAFTTWTQTVSSVLGGGYAVGANTAAESWTYDVLLDAGTYKALWVVRKHTAGPIITPTLDGTGLTTVDTYNGSSLGDQKQTQTGITVAAAGRHTLVMTNATRNASNVTGWNMTPQYVEFIRTGS